MAYTLWNGFRTSGNLDFARYTIKMKIMKMNTVFRNIESLTTKKMEKLKNDEYLGAEDSDEILFYY